MARPWHAAGAILVKLAHGTADIHTDAVGWDTLLHDRPIDTEVGEQVRSGKHRHLQAAGVVA